MQEQSDFPSKWDILDAAARIAPFAHRTPVLTSSTFDKACEAEIFFKCENFQKVGAFKFRGAINTVLLLKEDRDVSAVATHSSGNHAQALALAAKMNGLPAYIVMPENAPEVKKNAVRDYGAEIVFCKPTLQAREEELEKVVKSTGAVFVPPFDDNRIISGQATAALELMEDVSDLDLIIAPVGGGGLLSGTALVATYFSNSIQVVAGEPEMANDAFLSFQQRKRVTLQAPKSIADGLLTSLSEKTFHIISDHVTDIFTVSEAEISAAMKMVWERMKVIIEPSSAVAVAALLKNPSYFKGKRIGVILTGGNVDLNNLRF